MRSCPLSASFCWVSFLQLRLVATEVSLPGVMHRRVVRDSAQSANMHSDIASSILTHKLGCVWVLWWSVLTIEFPPNSFSSTFYTSPFLHTSLVLVIFSKSSGFIPPNSVICWEKYSPIPPYSPCQASFPGNFKARFPIGSRENFTLRKN